MHHSFHTTRSITASRHFLPLLLCLACGGGADLLEPATLGALHVTTTTTGQTPDPDGYTLLLDGADAGVVGANADTTIDSLASGPHTVAIAGLAGNCGIDGASQLSATVRTGARTEAGFVVRCTDLLPPPPTSVACVGPQVTNAAQWTAAIAGGLGVPGGTIWVRAGTYPGESTILASNRIIRACPGERVTVGNLVVFGAGVTIWGLEVAGTIGSGKLGMNVRAPGSRMINNVVHTSGASGIGFWEEATNSEVVGNIVYDNGSTVNLDHGIYANGRFGTKLIRDNIVLGNKAYGIHLYAGDRSQFLNGITVRGNIVADHPDRADFIIGTTDNLAGGLVLDSNTTYRPDRSSVTADLGWNAGPARHEDLTLRDNYWVGSVDHISKWRTLTRAGDTVIGSAAPTANKVVIRKNPYEGGRANVAIYNWAGGNTVDLDLGGVLEQGQRYELRRATDFYGVPLLAGSYAGPLAVPMTGEFEAFVLIGK